MTSRNAWQRLLRGYFPAEIGRRSLKLGCCSRFFCSTSRFLLEFAFCSWQDAQTCLLLSARRHKREKIAQMGRFSEWRCALGQTTSLWSWWEMRMQKRLYCTWETVFSPVPSEGRTAQAMDCEDLSEKYPTYTKHLCLWCPLRWRETSRYFSIPARFAWSKPAKKERLSHVSNAARFPDEVEMDVDGNISREAGRLQIFRGSWWIGRSRLFPLPKKSRGIFSSWGPHEELMSPHEELMSPHEELMSPHEELMSPHEELMSPHEELMSPDEELMSPHEGSWGFWNPHEQFSRGILLMASRRLLMSFEKCSWVLTNRPL